MVRAGAVGRFRQRQGRPQNRRWRSSSRPRCHCLQGTFGRTAMLRAAARGPTGSAGTKTAGPCKIPKRSPRRLAALGAKGHVGVAVPCGSDKPRGGQRGASGPGGAPEPLPGQPGQRGRRQDAAVAGPRRVSGRGVSVAVTDVSLEHPRTPQCCSGRTSGTSALMLSFVASNLRLVGRAPLLEAEQCLREPTFRSGS